MEVCRRQSCLHHCPCSAHHQSQPVHSVWDDYVPLAWQPNQLDAWWQVRGQTRCVIPFWRYKKSITWLWWVIVNSSLCFWFWHKGKCWMSWVFFLSLISRFSGMKNSQHNYNWDVPQRARRPGMTAGVGLQLYSLRQKWQWQFNLCLTFSFVFIAALFSDETVECRSYRANPRIIYVVLLKRALTYSLRPFPLSRASHNTTHSFNSVTV